MTDRVVPAADILPLLDEMQAISRSGLAFATSPYDQERYRRINELLSECYGGYLELPSEEVRRRWAAEIGHITPKVGAEAAVFDGEGRILLLRRSDDGCWGLPGGWLEPNESPVEAAVRETREETGLEVRVNRLVDVFTRRARREDALQAAVALVYLCDAVGGSPRLSHESTELAFLPLQEVDAWHGWHREHAEAAHRLWSSATDVAPPPPGPL